MVYTGTSSASFGFCKVSANSYTKQYIPRYNHCKHRFCKVNSNCCTVTPHTRTHVQTHTHTGICKLSTKDVMIYTSTSTHTVRVRVHAAHGLQEKKVDMNTQIHTTHTNVPQKT